MCFVSYLLHLRTGSIVILKQVILRHRPSSSTCHNDASCSCLFQDITRGNMCWLMQKESLTRVVSMVIWKLMTEEKVFM